MSLGDHLNAECDVLELQQQPTSSIMSTQRTWTDTGRNVRTRFELMSASTAAHWAASNVIASHIFFFDYDPQLIELKHALLFQGKRYEVQIVDNIANMNRMWEVITQWSRHVP